MAGDVAMEVLPSRTCDVLDPASVVLPCAVNACAMFSTPAP
jgi:hypothetical protein